MIFYTYFASIKNNLFDYKNRGLMEQIVEVSESLEEIDDDNLEGVTEPVSEEKTSSTKKGTDYSYIGYLNVPDVNIKRGFVDINSKYNSISYNVTVIKGSTMPDVENGNLILAAHRGNSSVSFFDKLYKLKDGAEALVTYNGHVYTYKLVNRYNVPKNGTIKILRNGEINTLTLITCTRNDKKSQTVFIFELDHID